MIQYIKFGLNPSYRVFKRQGADKRFLVKFDIQSAGDLENEADVYVSLVKIHLLLQKISADKKLCLH